MAHDKIIWFREGLNVDIYANKSKREQQKFKGPLNLVNQPVIKDSLIIAHTKTTVKTIIEDKTFFAGRLL